MKTLKTFESFFRSNANHAIEDLKSIKDYLITKLLYKEHEFYIDVDHEYVIDDFPGKVIDEYGLDGVPISGYMEVTTTRLDNDYYDGITIIVQVAFINDNDILMCAYYDDTDFMESHVDTYKGPEDAGGDIDDYVDQATEYERDSYEDYGY